VGWLFFIGVDYVRAYMDGTPHLFSLKKLSGRDLFDFCECCRARDNSQEMDAFHELFAEMLSRLVNLEELSALVCPDALLWQAVQTSFASRRGERGTCPIVQACH